MKKIGQYGIEFNFTTEILEEGSMTEPNQAYTIRELFARMKAGLPVNVSRPMEFGLDEDDPDSFDVAPHRVPDHDLTDIQNFSEYLEDRIKNERTVPPKPQMQVASPPAAPNPDGEVSGASAPDK